MKSLILAERKGPADVYGRLTEEKDHWTPHLVGDQNDEDAISELADSLYRKEGDKAENRRIPAAYTFFGQFVTHDVTFDTRLDPRNVLDPRRNLRTPSLDLDSVYGHGPVEQPYLYELNNPDRFWVPRNVLGEIDLPRNDDASVVHPSAGGSFNLRRTALIADPRNDENTLISQLHLAFLRFHNARIDEGHSFEEARKLTTWHYQWVLVHDYLRRVCGNEVVEKLKDSNRIKLKPQPVLPHEFTLAAFRFGHSMIGSAYHLNDALQEVLGEPITLFENIGTAWRDRDRVAANTLEGERALPRDWTVQWDRFVYVRSGPTQWSRRIDRELAPPLRYLPVRSQDPRHRSLAYLTLLRGFQQMLASGQTHAGRFDLEVVGDKTDSDPLWLYVLKEAEITEGGSHLGPLGAMLVSDVLIGLLQQDSNSFVSEPGWTPTLPHDPLVGFGLADFLASAGVPITASDWERQRG